MDCPKPAYSFLTLPPARGNVAHATGSDSYAVRVANLRS